MNFLVVSAAALATVVVLFAITFAIGRWIGRYNVVDVAWGLGFVAVAAVSAVAGTGDETRRWLLLALVAVWGLRLAWHMYGKSAGKGEDPSVLTVVRKIFVVQAAATWFVSLPLQLSASTGATSSAFLPVLLVGVALWLVGVLFEADHGLWAWTRHPNYFGDACVWWGLWLVTVNGLPALATVLSPALMTYFLVYATGARPTEKLMADRPGFSEYCSRTSFFIPTRPRTRQDHQ